MLLMYIPCAIMPNKDRPWLGFEDAWRCSLMQWRACWACHFCTAVLWCGCAGWLAVNSLCPHFEFLAFAFSSHHRSWRWAPERMLQAVAMWARVRAGTVFIPSARHQGGSLPQEPHVTPSLDPGLGLGFLFWTGACGMLAGVQHHRDPVLEFVGRLQAIGVARS